MYQSVQIILESMGIKKTIYELREEFKKAVTSIYHQQSANTNTTDAPYWEQITKINLAEFSPQSSEKFEKLQSMFADKMWSNDFTDAALPFFSWVINLFIYSNSYIDGH